MARRLWHESLAQKLSQYHKKYLNHWKSKGLSKLMKITHIAKLRMTQLATMGTL